MAIGDAGGRRRAVATAVSVTAVGALAWLTAWATTASAPAVLGWLDVAAAVAAMALTAWTIRRPVVGGVAAGLLAAVSPVLTPASSFAVLRGAQVRPFRQAAAVAVTGVAGQAVQGLWRPTPGLAYRWWLLLMVVGYAALLGWGTWAQARRNLVLALRERARRAEEDQQQRVTEARRAERTRIAREMHDVLAHRLSLLAAYAGAVQYRPDSPPHRLVEAAGVIRDSAQQALDELREVLTLLRREDADDDPDAPTPRNLSDLPHLIEEARAAGQRVDVEDAVLAPDLPPQAGRTAYRVVQEGLTNARRHAPGQAVTLTLTGGPGSRLTIDVRNPTLAEAPAPAGGGTGLVGLAERVALSGGGLSHEIGADGRFRLSAWLPWPA